MKCGKDVDDERRNNLEFAWNSVTFIYQFVVHVALALLIIGG
jgi:hypothetical protein